MNTVKEEYIKYLNREYEDTKRAINHPMFSRKKLVNNAINRCLGVAFFVQYLGVPFKFSNRYYEETKAKLEELRDSET